VGDAVERLGIAQVGELRPGDAVALGVLRRPESYLAGYFGRRTGRVARDDFHADACRTALRDRCRYVGTDRVADGEDAEESHAARGDECRAVGPSIGGNDLVGQ